MLRRSKGLEEIVDKERLRKKIKRNMIIVCSGAAYFASSLIAFPIQYAYGTLSEIGMYSAVGSIGAIAYGLYSTLREGNKISKAIYLQYGK